MATPETALDLLHRLARDPRRMGWSTQWQVVCTSLWALPMSTADEDIFTGLLRDPDCFHLARLVVPAFRSADLPMGLTTQQQRIFQEIAHVRNQTLVAETTSQGDFDSLSLKQEKQTLLNAEMHRARLLLHDSSAFGSESQHAIRAWLDAAPSAAKPSSSSQ